MTSPGGASTLYTVEVATAPKALPKAGSSTLASLVTVFAFQQSEDGADNFVVPISFAPARTSYDLGVLPSTVKTLTFTLYLLDRKATIPVTHALPSAPQTYTASATLRGGANTFWFPVTAPGSAGATNYSFTAHSAASSSLQANLLSALSLTTRSGAPLALVDASGRSSFSPSFQLYTFDYVAFGPDDTVFDGAQLVVSARPLSAKQAGQVGVLCGGDGGNITMLVDGAAACVMAPGANTILVGLVDNSTSTFYASGGGPYNVTVLAPSPLGAAVLTGFGATHAPLDGYGADFAAYEAEVRTPELSPFSAGFRAGFQPDATDYVLYLDQACDPPSPPSQRAILVA